MPRVHGSELDWENWFHYFNHQHFGHNARSDFTHTLYDQFFSSNKHIYKVSHIYVSLYLFRPRNDFMFVSLIICLSLISQISKGIQAFSFSVVCWFSKFQFIIFPSDLLKPIQCNGITIYDTETWILNYNSKTEYQWHTQRVTCRNWCFWFLNVKWWHIFKNYIDSVP